MPYLARLIIAILLMVALAEVAPDLVNAVLALLLIGIVLTNWKSFSGLSSLLASLGGKK